MKIKALLPIIIIGFILVLACHFIAIAAIDAPHNEANSVSCGSCHGQGLLQSFWGGSGLYSTVDELCLSCHKRPFCPYTDDDAPQAKIHLDSDENALAECRDCHDPHYQKQKNYKNTDWNNLYLAFGTITDCVYNGDGTSTLTYDSITYKTGWDATRLIGKKDICRHTILFPNVKKLGYSYPIIEVDTPTANTITVKGDTTPVYQYISSSDFAVLYGQYIKDNINGNPVKFFDLGGVNSFADGDGIYDGICEVCHTLPDAPHFEATRCTTCHSHSGGLRPSSGYCTGCHSLSFGGRAAITQQFNSNSHHVQDVSLTDAHCYQCHWEAKADGTINNPYHEGYNSETKTYVSGEKVDLVIYGAGTRPETYTAGTTAIQYMANGMRAEFEKLNDHCISCHSDQNNTTVPFAGDLSTPKEYAWDNSSIDARYSQAGGTTWGKWDPAVYLYVSPKYNQTKAYSAHGNATNNAGGFDLDETWPNKRDGSVNVICFDCHNSHGSSVQGPTTSYTSATTNGGILKDTVAGKGGYSVAYKPEAGGSTDDKSAYNAGAGLCFDCHMNATPEATRPWGYSDTYGALYKIMGYRDTDYFGPGVSGSQNRYGYKRGRTHSGGHFGASSPLATTVGGSINGLCTPCHDPHGVSATLNQEYSVPLLKGTWMTSLYKEDAAPTIVRQYNNFEASIPGYYIDQNTLSTTWKQFDYNLEERIAEEDIDFGGLCLLCHSRDDIDPDTSSTWKTMDKIHDTVKGWGNNTLHSFPCSKCHTPHNSRLPRLMVTNCLDYNHRGQVGSGGYPGKYSRDHRCGYPPDVCNAGGKYPTGGNDGEGYIILFGRTKLCHRDVNQETNEWPVREPWNTIAEWEGISITSGPSAGSFTAVGSDVRATITWTTDAASTSYVDYGLSPLSYEPPNYSTAGNTNMVTNHSVLLTNLTNHNTYYYRVFSQGDTATASQYYSFYIGVPPTTPVLVDEPHNTSTDITLEWYPSTDPDGGPVEYRVQVDDDPNFNSVNYNSYWNSAAYYNCEGGGLCSWSFTSINNVKWFWRVKARDANYPFGAGSDLAYDDFGVVPPNSPPFPPTLIDEPNYDGGGTDTDIALEWYPETDPDGTPTIEYYIEVYDNQTFSGVPAFESSVWITDTSFDITVGPCTEWWWRVKARDAYDGESGWAWDYFADDLGEDCIDYFTPTVPVLIDEPDNTSTTVTLVWNASTSAGSGPIEYKVQVNDKQGWGWTESEYNSGWITGTSWSVSIPFDTAQTWWWRVKARDSNHDGAVSEYSLTDSFRVVHPDDYPSLLPTVPFIIDEPDHECPAPCTITLEWHASTNPNGNPLEYQVKVVDDDLDWVSPEYNSGWISETTLCSGSQCSWSPTMRPYNDITWSWRVMARDAVTQDKSGGSVIDSFKVTPPPDSPPLAPILIPETDFNSDITTNITLEWNPEPDPDGNPVEYYVEVDDASDFSSPDFVASWITAVSFDITVGSCTEWWWRVKARDAVDTGQESPWSDTDFFVDVSTSCTGYFTPSVPVLIDEPHNITTTVTLAWNPSTGAGYGPYQYQVYVDDSPDFTSVNHNSGWIYGTSWTFTSSNNIKWYWKVRARDPNHSNTTTAWSDSDSFWVLPPNSPPPAPTLIDEPDFDGGGTDTPVTLEWIPETDPDGHSVEYYVELYDNPDCSGSPYSESSDWTSDTSFGITVAPCTEWCWRVKARDEFDQAESGWSNDDFADVLGTDCINHFTPTVPILIDEPDNETSVSYAYVTLQWNASTSAGYGPIEYRVKIDNNKEFGSAEYDSGWITGTSWTTPSITRDINTTWWWRVRARDANYTDAASVWALKDSFRVVPIGDTTRPPTIPYPIVEPDHECTVPCPVTLEWYASTNPSGNGLEYIVYVDDNSDFSSVEYNSDWISGTNHEITVRPYNDITWYWKVRARDAVDTGVVTVWSGFDSFKVVQPPDSPPLAPILIPEPNFNSDVTTDITLEWYPETDPDGHSVEYYVEVDDASDFSNPTTSGWTSAVSFDISVASCTEWFWRVKARDASDYAESPWSDTDFFVDVSTSCTGYFTPSVPVLIDEPNNNSTTVTLEWNASTGAGNGPYEYRVQVDDSPDFTSVNHDSDWISGTSWTFTSANDIKWYWSVRARDSNHTDAKSDWSDSDSFWVLPPNSPPPAPTLVDQPDFDGGGTDTPITLEWIPETDPDGNGVEYYVEVDDNFDFSSPDFVENWDTDTSFDITVGPCTEWWWRVKARDEFDQAESGWSNDDYFKDSTDTCTFTIIDESFEGIGYEETWTESVGSGCSLYEDSSIPGTAPPGSGSECLRSISGSPDYKAFATRDYGSEQPNTSTSFYLYVEAEGLSNGENKNIGILRDSANNDVFRLRLNQNTGQLRFNLRVYNNGSLNDYYTDIFEATWYKIKVKYNNVNDTWEWWVDDISQNSGSLTGTHYTGIQTWIFGFWWTSQARTGTIYFDLINVKINE